MTLDRAVNLYGTAYNGGVGYGTVFEIRQSGVFNPLYEFRGSDGANPRARVIFGSNGTLYGTTQYGGTSFCGGQGCGVVFNLRPPPTVCKTTICFWMETVVFSFDVPGGDQPGYGDLLFQTGDIY